MVKLEKKDFWLLAAIMVFLVGVVYVIAYPYSQPIPNPGHGGDEVFIHINGADKSLQDAINDGNFSLCPITGGSYSSSVIHGHKGEQIIVNVNGSIKNFQDAINDGSLSYAEVGTSPSNFGVITGQNQTGDEVWVDVGGVEKTLQQAINDSDFSGCVVGQEVNLALGGTPSHQKILANPAAYCYDYFGYGLGWIEIDSRLNDNSTSLPAVGVLSDYTHEYDSEIALAQESSVNRIEVFYRGIIDPGSTYIRAEIYNGVSWQTVGTFYPYSIYGDSIGDMPAKIFTFNSSAPWNNVKKVRVKVRGDCLCCSPSGFCYCAQDYIYEIRIFGAQ